MNGRAPSFNFPTPAPIIAIPVTYPVSPACPHTLTPSNTFPQSSVTLLNPRNYVPQDVHQPTRTVRITSIESAFDSVPHIRCLHLAIRSLIGQYFEPCIIPQPDQYPWARICHPTVLRLSFPPFQPQGQNPEAFRTSISIRKG